MSLPQTIEAARNVLRDARPLPLTPLRGQLGFFDVLDDLLRSNVKGSGLPQPDGD